MNRIFDCLIAAVVAASPLGVRAQSAVFDTPSLASFGQMMSPLPVGSGFTPLPMTIVPGISGLSPTLGTGAATLPTVGAPSIGTPLLPTIGTPTTPTIGTPTLPTIGTPTFPAIGTSLSPTIGTPTTPTIGTSLSPTLGTPLDPTLGTPLFPGIGTPMMPTIGTSLPPTIGTPTTPTIGLQPIPPIGPSTSLIGAGAISTGSVPRSGGGSSLTGSGIGAGSDLCAPEDFLCGGVVVRP